MKTIHLFLRFVGILFLLVISLNPAWPEERVLNSDTSALWWQLTFSYDSNSLNLVEAAPIPPMAKKIRTPGLAGAPLKLSCNLSWVSAKGQSLMSVPVEIPLGVRSVLTPDEKPENDYIPPSSVFVVRVQGPEPSLNPKTIKLLQTGIKSRGLTADSLPASLQFTEKEIPIERIREDSKRILDGPLSSSIIHDTGPDSNRLVIVVLGDGYTYSNLTVGSYDTHCQTLVDAFKGKAPWDIYFDAANVYKINVESNEEGADEPSPGPGILKDTYLNSSFWVSGIERLLYLNSTGISRAINAANAYVGVGTWDAIIVLVNSTKYGGGGGSIAVSSVHPAASEVILHEFGHSFAGLADEYDYGGTGVPSSDYEPNVDFHYELSQLKWKDWVETSTPLPTPATLAYDTVVGAFLGAKYWPSGIYRPWNNCLMRALSRPFCPVCKQAHVLEMTTLLQLVDSQTPSPSQVVPVNSIGVNFSVEPLPIGPITYQWYLNGTLLSGETSAQIYRRAQDLSEDTSILRVQVNHPTELVRDTEIYKTYDWSVQPVSTRVPEIQWSFYE